MSDRAEKLTTKLRKEFGTAPVWNTTSTKTCLDQNDSEWNITRMYCLAIHDYSRYQPLARMLHRMCKKEIGKHPDITEDMIKRWLALDYKTDVQVRAEYQRLFDKARPEVRRSKKLLVEMRRDLGDCHMVGELHVLRWLENGLTEGDIKGKYKGAIERASLITRAEALRYRLEDEVRHKPAPSVPELLKRIRDNSDVDDNAIVNEHRQD
jgi:hypothetical protein